MDFSSDTSAPAHPNILDAIIAANTGTAPSYGSDGLSETVRTQLKNIFECDLDVYLTSSGTAANALALSTLCPSTSSILCHEEAHIERDERGAPEFFTGGAKLYLLPGAHAKIDLLALKTALAARDPEFVHETPSEVLSLTNLTESGTAYTVSEITERAQLAKAYGLQTHLDGARFANALATTGASPAEMSWRAGIDVLTFGATKNGAIGCEAIILFGDARKRLPNLKARAKRAGHMPPKMRFLAAQMHTYLKDDLWLSLARSANNAAQRLSDTVQRAGSSLAHPVDGNEVFANLTDEQVGKLKSNGAKFYPWIDGSQRFVCSWATPEADIKAFEDCLT